jgi:predicted amidohydrolase
MSRKVNVALIQLRNATPDVPANCKHMGEMVRRAMKEGGEKGQKPDIVVLPVRPVLPPH